MIPVEYVIPIIFVAFGLGALGEHLMMRRQIRKSDLHALVEVPNEPVTRTIKGRIVERRTREAFPLMDDDSLGEVEGLPGERR